MKRNNEVRQIQSSTTNEKENNRIGSNWEEKCVKNQDQKFPLENVQNVESWKYMLNSRRRLIKAAASVTRMENEIKIAKSIIIKRGRVVQERSIWSKSFFQKRVHYNIERTWWRFIWFRDDPQTEKFQCFSEFCSKYGKEKNHSTQDNYPTSMYLFCVTIVCM